LLLRDTEADIAAKGRAFISYLSCEGADAAALLARKSIGYRQGTRQDAAKLKDWQQAKS
jgi:hypothetical protein